MRSSLFSTSQLKRRYFVALNLLVGSRFPVQNCPIIGEISYSIALLKAIASRDNHHIQNRHYKQTQDSRNNHPPRDRIPQRSAARCTRTFWVNQRSNTQNESQRSQI